MIAHSLGTTAVLLSPRQRGHLDPGRFVAISPMANTRTMSRGFATMTGFSEPVGPGQCGGASNGRFNFQWEEIEPMMLAQGFQNEALVIHDHDDRELPVEEAEALARALPDGRLLTTTGLGHHRILRDPGVVSAVVGFLARSSLQRNMTVAESAA